MAKKDSNADQLITTILSGIEDVKGKDIRFTRNRKYSLRLLYCM